ncbi:MAG: hypothetical protein IKD76_04470 [Clostridia bacterium]|nr:hypothetical protein [Clostridia bacterium]
MKKSKQIRKITFIVMLIFVVMSFVKISKGAVFENVETGILEVVGGAGIVALGWYWYQAGAVLLFKALQLLVTAITGGLSNSASEAMYRVLFNKVEMTSANFFPDILGPLGQTSASSTIVTNIAQFYNLMRVMSIALLLFVLVYVGIRMAISTVAEEKARYKNMFTDWLISLVLVFMLHYIIIIVFYINGSLVHSLEGLDPVKGSALWEELWARALIPAAGIDELIVCGAFTVASLAFVLIYIKRAIVLAFLIVISPLITITYAIDKIGDGKSQALNTWMREFISTVLIQPFHCIIYIVFYSSIMNSMGGTEDLGKMFFASATALFMLKAENIVKKIFGIAPNSMGDAMGAGAMALTAATSIFKTGGKGGAGAGGKAGGKGNMPTMKNNESKPSTGVKKAAEAVADKVKDTKVGKMLKNSYDRDGIVANIANPRRRIAGAATLAGAIAGGALGDAKAAASMGTAFGGVAKGIQEDIEVRRNERKLEKNQKVFAGAYNDFEAAYMARHAGASKEEVRAAVKDIYESDGHGLTEQYQKDMYKQIKDFTRSATAGGQEDAFDFADYSMQLAQDGVIKPPKNYQQKIYP